MAEEVAKSNLETLQEILSQLQNPEFEILAEDFRGIFGIAFNTVYEEEVKPEELKAAIDVIVLLTEKRFFNVIENDEEKRI